VSQLSTFIKRAKDQHELESMLTKTKITYGYKLAGGFMLEIVSTSQDPSSRTKSYLHCSQ